MQKTQTDFKSKNIVITEPKRPFQITKPFAMRGIR
jgi:hypothetical protein